MGNLDVYKIIVIVTLIASSIVAYKIFKVERELIKKYGWRHNYKTTVFVASYMSVYTAILLWIVFTI